MRLTLKREALAAISAGDLAAVAGGRQLSAPWMPATCAYLQCVDDTRTLTDTLFCDAPTTMC